VIYVDFWGTWCAPCRENMKLMPTIKEELADREVIFMYFANNSPEQSWKSVIKEMGLTAPNVVHYRLPDEQEALIERYFSIDSFPTYLLVDRQGNVLDRDAPDPRDKNRLFKALDNARAR
jgi:thiol-disulfide isomerase/thioredoxin